MKESFEKLVKLVEELRHKCPWDKEQTFESTIKEIHDEAKELEQAIKKKDYENMREELGDMIHAIIFMTNIAKEKGLFEMKDIIEEVHEKMVRRHPWVFEGKEVKNKEEALKLWHEIKNKEKWQKSKR